MFGPDQDNYIKLVAIVQEAPQGLQFYSENKVGTTIGPIVPISSPSILPVLRLFTDPQAGTVQAAATELFIPPATQAW